MFKYKVKDKNGEIKTGVLDVNSKEKAMNILSNQSSFIISLTDTDMSKKLIIIGKNRIKKKTISIFMRKLATMLNAQVDVPTALKTIIDGEKDVVLKGVLESIYGALNNGRPLSECFKAFPKHFPPFITSLIETGQKNGRFDEVFERIAETLEKQNKIKAKVRSALIYPSILVLMSFAVSIILTVVVIPAFSEIFDMFDTELPLITKMLMGFSVFLRKYWMFLIAILIGIGIGLRYLLVKEKYKKYLEYFVSKLPIIGDIRYESNMGIFCRSMGALFGGGVEITTALAITQTTMPTVMMKKAVEIVNLKVRQGLHLSEALKEVEGFSSLVISMLEIGEHTGKLDEVFENAADMYESDVNDKVSNLLSIIEPMTTVLLAGVIAVIVLAVVIPMFQIYTLIE